MIVQDNILFIQQSKQIMQHFRNWMDFFCTLRSFGKEGKAIFYASNCFILQQLLQKKGETAKKGGSEVKFMQKGEQKQDQFFADSFGNTLTSQNRSARLSATQH